MALMLTLAAAGCASRAPEDGKIAVVCTSFPQYDWARALIRGREGEVALTLIADNGADIHSYMPTADDIIAITAADVVIYNGGASDAWVRDALKGRTDGVVVMLEVEGAARHEAEEAEAHEGGAHEHGEECELDEHCWLSLRSASLICGAIAEALTTVDRDGADVYEANLEAYRAELSSLDGEFEAAVEGAKRRALVVADRFPFLYLTEDYGIEYIAAFPGCSAETEASFETVAKLAERVKELELPYVIALDTGDGAVARAVIAASGVEARVITLHAIQSATDMDTSYIALMRENLEALREALN